MDPLFGGERLCRSDCQRPIVGQLRECVQVLMNPLEFDEHKTCGSIRFGKTDTQRALDGE